jgi:hypothetical protein
MYIFFLSILESYFGSILSYFYSFLKRNKSRSTNETTINNETYLKSTVVAKSNSEKQYYVGLYGLDQNNDDKNRSNFSSTMATTSKSFTNATKMTESEKSGNNRNLKLNASQTMLTAASKIKNNFQANRPKKYVLNLV